MNAGFSTNPILKNLNFQNFFLFFPFPGKTFPVKKPTLKNSWIPAGALLSGHRLNSSLA
jgi:hypothetical protein